MMRPPWAATHCDVSRKGLGFAGLTFNGCVIDYIHIGTREPDETMSGKPVNPEWHLVVRYTRRHATMCTGMHSWFISTCDSHQQSLDG